MHKDYQNPETFRRERQNKSLTQAQLAKELGCSLRAVQFWEAGDRPILERTAKLMESVCGGSK